MTHTIEAITFVPRTNEGDVTCSCGWTGWYVEAKDTNTYAQHRRDAGAGAAWLSQVGTDPKRAREWRQMTTKPKPDPKPKVSRYDRLKQPCANGHEPNWAINSEGARRCKTCDLERWRAKRAAQRVA